MRKTRLLQKNLLRLNQPKKLVFNNQPQNMIPKFPWRNMTVGFASLVIISSVAIWQGQKLFAAEYADKAGLSQLRPVAVTLPTNQDKQKSLWPTGIKQPENIKQVRSEFTTDGKSLIDVATDKVIEATKTRVTKIATDQANSAIKQIASALPAINTSELQQAAGQLALAGSSAQQAIAIATGSASAPIDKTNPATSPLIIDEKLKQETASVADATKEAGVSVLSKSWSGITWLADGFWNWFLLLWKVTSNVFQGVLNPLSDSIK